MRRARYSCNRRPLLAASVLTVVVVAATPGYPAKPSLDVTWTDRPIAIDADLDHWSGRLVPSADAPLSIGVANDADFLYIALASSDERVARSVFHRGMLIRIRPKGGTGGGERSATSQPPSISVKAKLQLAKATSPQ